LPVAHGTQKNVDVCVFAPLSHDTVTVQLRSCGTAGTRSTSWLPLAGKAKDRFTMSVAYVQCDDVPLRSVMCARRPPMIGLKSIVGPAGGCGGAAGGAGVGVGTNPFAQPDSTMWAPCLLSNMRVALDCAFCSATSDAPTVCPKSFVATAAHALVASTTTTHWCPPCFTQFDKAI
jgi:hypothetical protein